jgi:hypothetical protein
MPNYSHTYKRDRMDEKNLLLLAPEEMPVTDEAKKKPRINCLQEMLLELMDRDKVELVDIQKATGIKWPTLYGWYKGEVNAQMADENLLKLAKFFNVSLEYMCFGIGDDSPRYEEFDNEKTE